MGRGVQNGWMGLYARMRAPLIFSFEPFISIFGDMHADVCVFLLQRERERETMLSLCVGAFVYLNVHMCVRECLSQAFYSEMCMVFVRQIHI